MARLQNRFPAPAARYRWAVLSGATFAQAAAGFAFLGVGTLGGFFQEEFDLTGVQTGLIVTAVGLAPVFALVPVGRLLDRHGARGVVGGGALILAAGVGTAGLAPTYPMLLLVLLLGGVGYATSQPGGSKAVASWFSSRRRGLAMGIRQTGLPLGGAAAAAILPAVATSAGWRWAMFTAAVVTTLGGAVFVLAYRRSGSEQEDRSRRLPRLPEVMAIPALRPVLWTGFVMVGTQLCIVSYLMVFLRDVHALPLTVGAWFLFAAQLAGVAGRIFLAGWSDRLGAGRRMRAVELSMVVAAACAFVLPLLPVSVGEVSLSALVLLFGFFAFGWYGPWVAHVTDVAPSRAIGLTLGIAMTANQVGIAAAPPLFGLVLDISGGYVAPWWLVSGALASGAAWVTAGSRRDRR